MIYYILINDLLRVFLLGDYQNLRNIRVFIEKPYFLDSKQEAALLGLPAFTHNGFASSAEAPPCLMKREIQLGCGRAGWMREIEVCRLGYVVRPCLGYIWRGLGIL